jgi:hypothetical protein
MPSNEPRQIFGVIVRTFRLIVTAYGLYSAYYGILRWLGAETTRNLPASTAEGFAAFYFVLGVLTLRRADWIVRFTYGFGSETSN